MPAAPPPPPAAVPVPPPAATESEFPAPAAETASSKEEKAVGSPPFLDRRRRSRRPAARSRSRSRSRPRFASLVVSVALLLLLLLLPLVAATRTGSRCCFLVVTSPPTPTSARTSFPARKGDGVGQGGRQRHHRRTGRRRTAMAVLAGAVPLRGGGGGGGDCNGSTTGTTTTALRNHHDDDDDDDDTGSITTASDNAAVGVSDHEEEEKELDASSSSSSSDGGVGVTTTTTTNGVGVGGGAVATASSTGGPHGVVGGAAGRESAGGGVVSGGGEGEGDAASGRLLRQIPESSSLQKLAPSLLLAGVAVVYGAVLRHPRCVLTTPGVVSMLLLALSTSLQPRLSRAYLSSSALNKSTVALLEELIKTALASALYFLNSGRRRQAAAVASAVEPWTLSSSLHVAALPAALYALQGVLTYMSYPHLDAVTFNGLSQTKTVSAALFCYLVLRQTQTPRQLLSIAILVASAVVFNRKRVEEGGGGGGTTSSTGNGGDDAGKKEQGDDGRRRLLERWGKGVLPCLGATAVSGLAGAFSQRGLQVVHRDPYLFTIEVSAYSALTLLFSMALSSLTPHKRGKGEENAAGRSPPFSNWDSRVLIPIAFKAVGGIITALVHKHAGSVLKGFALVLGLVLSGLFQTAVDQKRLSTPQVAGTLLVLLSSWMHFTPTISHTP